MAGNHATLKTLGRNVRALREKKKLTQEALGTRSDLHITYISDIERGSSIVEDVLAMVREELFIRRFSVHGKMNSLALINNEAGLHCIVRQRSL